MRANLLLVVAVAAAPGLQSCKGGDEPADPVDQDEPPDTDAPVPFADHTGEGPWGVHLELLSIEGGSGPDGQLQVGDVPVATFSVTDDDGAPYDLAELYGLAFQLAGPHDHYQIALWYGDLEDPRTASVYNDDGTWTYDFGVPVPSAYHAVPNDTPDLGDEVGDWGGQPIADGTYTLAAWAYARVSRADGSYWYDAGNATSGVLVGEATAYASRQVVLAENCASCHGESFYAHGGSRREVLVCQTCHVAGAEDRNSSADPSTTPGANIGWDQMIHRIHAGATLAKEVTYNGYPADPDLPGYPDYNAHDYSGVVFPRWPMEVASCDACHGGAPDGDVFAAPTRLACGSCHDAVDFATGEGHDGGVQDDDATCSYCHAPDAVAAYHGDPRDDTTINPGLVVEVLSVTGGTGPEGQVLPGDTAKVVFRAAQGDGTAIAPSALGSATLVVSGPLDHMQQTWKSTTVTVDAVADGSDWAVEVPFPDVYPPQENDTVDLGEEVGDWRDLPVEAGTYRVALGAYVNVAVDDAGATARVPASATLDFLVGDATALATRDVVDEALCLGCHGTLEFHGKGRVGFDYCVTCHTAGSEDRYSGTDPTTTPGVTVNFAVMLHKIHGGNVLSETYEINGHGDPYTTHTYNQVGFPRFDGGVLACTACHGASTAWLDPEATVCSSCHDSEDAAVHVALNKDAEGREACDVCHGSGRDYAVDVAHDWLR